MSDATTTSPAEAGPLPRRLFQVFAAPAELFDRLRECPVWIDVLVLLVAASVASSFLIPEEAMRAMMEAQMPPDAGPEQVDQMMRFARGWSLVFAFVGTPIVVAAVAGFAILVFNVLLGGEATYRQLFSATAHAFVIYTAGALLALALLLGSGGGQLVTPSLHLLVPGLSEGYLFRFLRGLNLFSLWSAIVLGIAVSRIYPKRSAGPAATLFLGAYVAIIALIALPGG